MDIIDLIIKISSLIVAIGVILVNINKIFTPIYKKITDLEKNQCKNLLVDFLARVENNEKKLNVKKIEHMKYMITILLI